MWILVALVIAFVLIAGKKAHEEGISLREALGEFLPSPAGLTPVPHPPVQEPAPPTHEEPPSPPTQGSPPATPPLVLSVENVDQVFIGLDDYYWQTRDLKLVEGDFNQLRNLLLQSGMKTYQYPKHLILEAFQRYQVHCDNHAYIISITHQGQVITTLRRYMGGCPPRPKSASTYRKFTGHPLRYPSWKLGTPVILLDSVPPLAYVQPFASVRNFPGPHGWSSALAWAKLGKGVGIYRTKWGRFEATVTGHTWAPKVALVNHIPPGSDLSLQRELAQEIKASGHDPVTRVPCADTITAPLSDIVLLTPAIGVDALTGWLHQQKWIRGNPNEYWYLVIDNGRVYSVSYIPSPYYLAVFEEWPNQRLVRKVVG